MPFISDIEISFPKNFYKQDDLISLMSKHWKGKISNLNRVKTIQENTLVKSRHLAMPIESYFSDMSFEDKNKKFIECSVNIVSEAISHLLKKNNLTEKDISSLWSNTVTGIAVPSIEARVMNKLDFNKNTKRVPIMGLGCMAGAAGINRVADYLKGHPKEAVIFFSVELCSMTLQLQDISVANLVATALFGDAAGAVLMVGDEHPLSQSSPLKWIGSESLFFPDTEDVMGWNVGSSGMKIILSKSVPEITESLLPEPLFNFLKSQNIKLSDISNFFAHPGGPKVLKALEKVLNTNHEGLKHSWDSLSENGNMSSVSVLDIFKRNIESYDKSLKGNSAISLAMGPAFSAEMGLFKWQ